jgi:Ca-activated chloride channel family protein
MKVAVTDPLNRYVTGLEKQDFRIYEDNIRQTITHFSTQAAPVSVGVLFDISGSMGYDRNEGRAKKYIRPFLESLNPDDEYFLITFNQKVTLVESFTKQGATVQNDITLQKPGGRTALYDAVYLGLNEVNKAKNEKKALILISDGEDNSSRYTDLEVREFCRESDVQIYTIGLGGPLGYGRSVLEQFAIITGGRSFFPNGIEPFDVNYCMDLIQTELRHQYLLGYAPSNQVHDGKWRRIKIQLDAPRGFPKLSIRSRNGYYAPK